MPAKLYMVFDVESVGLYGEGFAVGYLVVDAEGSVHETALYACSPSLAAGTREGHEWVRDNVPELTPTHTAPWLVRARFWKDWLHWQEKGALLVADCAYPVEAGFLRDCVNDDPVNRTWRGPYPLHDVATMMLGKGRDPVTTTDRLPDEMPLHNPLCDARQSARLWLAALKQ